MEQFQINKHAILFVHSDIGILKNIRQMLAGTSEEWVLDFTTSGSDALRLLESHRYHIIVTHMQLQGISGLNLLDEVRQRYPNMVRMAMWCQETPGVNVSAVGLVHQHLCKPADPDFLTSALRRALDIRSMMHDEWMQSLVTRLDSLPSLPEYYYELMSLLSSEDVTIKAVAELVSRDIGMSAKMLQLVNSAFFGFSRHVSSPEQAVMLLGLEIVSAMALTVGIFNSVDTEELRRFNLNSLWDHSIQVGLMARRLARQEYLDKIAIDHAFIAGMLHDVGKIILVRNLPDEYSAAIARASVSARALDDIEHETFGVSHANVGAYLMALWGFENSIIEAMLYHHHPSESSNDQCHVLTAVHAANVIANHMNAGADGPTVSEFDRTYLARVGCSDRIEAWCELCAIEESR